MTTHADADSNRDGRVLHDNFGPMIWGRTWAIAADLLSRYEIPYAWDASIRCILIGSLDVAPTYRDDALHALHALVGWSLVELTLKTGNAPVIHISIIRPGTGGDRA